MFPWTFVTLSRQFPDGSSYVGEWKDNKRHGSGTAILVGGYMYEGEVRIISCELVVATV